jgi:cation diffusion facilitator CzcD-associated flavoprotein CzcO
MSEAEPHFEIAIVGAGLAGLGMAIALKEDGREDFVVLERAGDLGGTWRENSYPGCACDIPSVLYSYSSEQNPKWTHAFARQPEIWAYMQDVARRHELHEHFRFNHEITEARWSAEDQHWEIETTSGSLTAAVLISAAGALADPSIPDLPGLERFTGRVFHSARWEHDHDLKGRSVAVVGTGASAIQFVPEIQPEVGLLTHREASRLAAIEPTPAAQAQYVAEVDAGTEGSVWTAGGCLSWYVDETGRNSTLWPGSVRAYQRRLAEFDANDYSVEMPGRLPESVLA